MKSLLKISGILLFCSAYLLFTTSIAQFQVPGSATIYTENASEALEASDISNPIRDGAFKVINAEDADPDYIVGGLVSADTQIQSHETAKIETLQIIRNIINYALGLISLVALIYLIYHGILVMTAVGDETQYKKGLKGIKYAAIALAGVGLSWIIISGIFRVIEGAIAGGIVE